MTGRYSPSGRRDNWGGGRRLTPGWGFHEGHERGRFQGRLGRSSTNPFKQLQMKFFPRGTGRETQTAVTHMILSKTTWYNTYKRPTRHCHVTGRSHQEGSSISGAFKKRAYSNETDSVMSSNEQAGMDIMMYRAELKKRYTWIERTHWNTRPKPSLTLWSSAHVQLQQDNAELDWRTSWLLWAHN